MDKADKPLRFKLLPCPHCEYWPTVDAIRPNGDIGWKLSHTCPGLEFSIVTTYGENVRMTVQKWNKYAREWQL